MPSRTTSPATAATRAATARRATRRPAGRSSAKASSTRTMQAVRFRRPKSVTVADVPQPELQESSDVILKVTSTAICGSDLHIYNGLLPQLRPMTIGHEFMGEVVEAGSRVRNLRVGDRVVVPFPISCGSCFYCGIGEVTSCSESNPNWGPEGGLLKEKAAALFGYTDLYGGYDGGQAEYVRVPYADFGPRIVRDDMRDDEVLFLTDIFPTGYIATDWAKVGPDDTVAIFGAGPVGIMAAKSANLKGAREVILVDPLAYRLDIAERAADVTTVDSTRGEAVERIRELTQGRGADVVIDAVGMEADRNVLEKASAVAHGQRGTMKVLRDCFSAARRGGRVSIVGVYGTPYDNFPLHQFFDKGLKMYAGQVQVQSHIDHLQTLVERGEVRLDDIITHQMPLEDAPKAYKMFSQKKDDCLKVVLRP
ncbi:MAG TPA: zinc-dependent alcohol dehydrogenase [Candidatus Thermoplasmatota archaeon]|nr:zinc-dependent alcohol dehydrogenase [Candidatus Thermoplasmatota archaeon]